MPELYEISDGDIRSLLGRALPACDTGSPTSFEYALDQLVPVVRELLDRPRPGYTYRARIRRWIDADTVVLDMDLGLKQWAHEQEIRLNRVNAPDRQPAKGAATKWISDIAPVGTSLVVRTHLDKDDRYGRLLGDLYLIDSLGAADLNAALIDAGHGMPYAGGKRPEDY